MATAVDRRTMSATRPKFTDEQRQAVATRGVSVALSAGAGCGKTFVLTERFLAELEPGDPDAPPANLGDLVAITFTDRAAREMRDRIRAKCYERLESASSAHGNYWLGLLRSLDSARVSTIHSYCGALLRSHAVEAELDPQFAVLEPAQADTLLAELMDDMLRTKLAAREPAVLELVADYGLHRLREALADLLESSRSHDYRRWLDRKPAELVKAWREFHRTTAVPLIGRRVARCHAAQQIVNLLRENTLDDELLAKQTELLRLLPALGESSTIRDDLQEIRAHAQVGHSKKLWPSDELYAAFRDAATAFRKEIDKADRLIDFDAAAAESSARVGLALLRLVDDLSRAYEAAKREQAFLDFDDLLLRARRLLSDPRHKAVRDRIANGTKLLLVDECQDTDPVQVELIKALCGDNHPLDKLFFVGDFKQSIYRFRGADPTVFRRLEGETPESGRLPLSCNFRSQPAILNFVNALFCEAFMPAGEAPAVPYQPLAAQREQTHRGPAIEFIWYVADGQDAADDDANENAESPGAAELRRHEADWIARRIRQLLDGSGDGEPLLIHERSGVSRAVSAGDIAILFRALPDVAIYEEALRTYGIDYYLVGGHAFYAQQEIYDVVNLLRAIASPADEVSLAGVLRSPFFSLADETLFWLTRGEQGLWAGLCGDRLPPAIEGAQRQRATYAAKVLRELRAAKDRLPIAAVINTALDRTGYDAALLGEFLGERQLANLRKLIQQARSFDHTGMGLSDFIVQLSQFVARQPKESLAATQPETMKVVRLMTIHQAKGLEFPVVFVPDLARPVQEGSGSAVYSDELGPLARLPSDHDHFEATNGYRLHAVAAREEERQELIRLLYVATTRAADFLVLSSSVQNFNRFNGPWMELLSGRFELTSGSLKATLPRGYETPQIRVLMQPPPTGDHRGNTRTYADLEQIADEIEQAANTEDGRGTSCADPVACDAAARRRFSVSRLRGALDEGPATSFMVASNADGTGEAVDPLGLGTLVHAALANFNFRKPGDLKSHVLLHAEKLALRGESERKEALPLLESFVKSPRARALGEARQVLPEVEFLLAWPPADGTTDGRFLQGYLDCLYQDSAGHWHVLDYKTNEGSADHLPELVQQYELQMLVYGLAAEQALGEPVASLTVHFLRTGVEHVYVLDGPARRRAIELVNRAIDALCRPEPNPASPARNTAVLRQKTFLDV
jgi:ATP-dependent helicase/nuclease subunit A